MPARRGKFLIGEFIFLPLGFGLPVNWKMMTKVKRRQGDIGFLQMFFYFRSKKLSNGSFREIFEWSWERDHVLLYSLDFSSLFHSLGNSFTFNSFPKFLLRETYGNSCGKEKRISVPLNLLLDHTTDSHFR